MIPNSISVLSSWHTPGDQEAPMVKKKVRKSKTKQKRQKTNQQPTNPPEYPARKPVLSLLREAPHTLAEIGIPVNPGWMCCGKVSKVE